MSSSNTLVFRDFDWVVGGPTSGPTIDGFVEADFGISLDTDLEPGYVNGARLTYGNAPVPPVVVKTVKKGNSLVMGFLCRGEQSFDDAHKVTIILRPTPTSGAMRRIDIFPVWSDSLQEAYPDPVNGTGCGAAQRTGPLAGDHTHVPPGIAPDIRPDKTARKVDWLEWDGTNWQPMLAAPSGAEVKVRSWQPNTTDASPQERAWSVEIQIPLNVTVGGSNWIILDSTFGLFFSSCPL